MTSSNMRQKDIRPAPARIEFKGMKFLITDRPSDQTIANYIVVSIGSVAAGFFNYFSINYFSQFSIAGTKEK